MLTRWITALLVVLCLVVSALAEYSPAKCQKQALPLVRGLNGLSVSNELLRVPSRLVA